jgi:hypothetical protein
MGIYNPTIFQPTILRSGFQTPLGGLNRGDVYVSIRFKKYVQKIYFLI